MVVVNAGEFVLRVVLCAFGKVCARRRPLREFRTSSSTKVTFATGGPAPLALAIFLVTRCHGCLCGREGEEGEIVWG